MVRCPRTGHIVNYTLSDTVVYESFGSYGQIWYLGSSFGQIHSIQIFLQGVVLFLILWFLKKKIFSFHFLQAKTSEIQNYSFVLYMQHV